MIYFSDTDKIEYLKRKGWTIQQAVNTQSTYQNRFEQMQITVAEKGTLQLSISNAFEKELKQRLLEL